MNARLEDLSDADLLYLRMKTRWDRVARPKQKVPSTNWITYGWLSGRGFGKTRAAANWMAAEALNDPSSFNHVIAPTQADVRYTCFEGETGLISVIPEQLITNYNRSDLILYLHNGAIIRGFGSETPDKLRGPQCARAWCEEVAAWSYADETWKMMQLGLRLGAKTQLVWTTTPKPVPIMKTRLAEEDARHIIVRGTTYENRANLAENFFSEIAKFEGTRIGRQEIYGEVIDPEEAGIVRRSQWRMWPAKKTLPVFSYVVMSLDTAFTEKTFDKKTAEADRSACQVWGLFDFEKRKHAMLLDAWREMIGFPELVDRVRKESKIAYGAVDAPLFGSTLLPSKYAGPGITTGRNIDTILIEDKGSGISLRQVLALENILTVPYNPGRADKLARLHSCTPMFAHGRVWGVESNNRLGQFRDWAEPVVEAMCTFHGEGTIDHDDDVDAATQCLNYFMHQFVHTFVVKTAEEQEKERVERRPKPRVNPYG